MGWREIIGNFLERFDAPNSTVRTIPDPFNYTLDRVMNSREASPVIVHALKVTFPLLSSQNANNILKEAQNLNHQALLIYYDVRDGLLTEAEAEERIKTSYPKIDAVNFSRLRASCHIATSK